MKLIILDAGDSFELDGFNKLLIKEPKTKKTILQSYTDLFKTDQIEIVVGYKSMEIMNAFPNYIYHYNKKWQVTGNSYSLALALDDTPCYVISSDFFLKQPVIQALSQIDNGCIIQQSENRLESSLNTVIQENKIHSIYKGKSRNNDPELMGIFKITNPKLLREWKKRCIQNPDRFAAENLPLDLDVSIQAKEIYTEDLVEINTPRDYIKLLEKQ